MAVVPAITTGKAWQSLRNVLDCNFIGPFLIYGLGALGPKVA